MKIQKLFIRHNEKIIAEIPNKEIQYIQYMS